MYIIDFIKLERSSPFEVGCLARTGLIRYVSLVIRPYVAVRGWFLPLVLCILPQDTFRVLELVPDRPRHEVVGQALLTWK